MSKKNAKVPSQYKESKEQRLIRIREESGRFMSRIETPKTVYNRKKLNNAKHRGGDNYD